MKIAYADPPYIGQAKKHYSHDVNCAEVDHVQLINQLESSYDGWALSMSVTMESLKTIIAIAPNDSRLAAWVKPFCSWKKGVFPAYSWEGVLFKSCRKKAKKTIRDHVACNITLKKNLAGAKPREFCFWLFDLLNMRKGDELHDLFPGTGIISTCFKEWSGRLSQGELFHTNIGIKSDA